VDGRIDHGIDGLVDEAFRNHLIENNMTLAVCPTLFFNKKPADSAYFRDVSKAVKFMLVNNMKVTISTDDPGIFDLNYIGDLFHLVQKEVALTKQEIAQLARNSFEMLWIDDVKKNEYLKMLQPFEAS
jgi:adenine deaminase